ncbi:MAG TPA: hypothetical protein VIR59_09950 [Gaiellaceae bacterium]|jgi:hypothetical protein
MTTADQKVEHAANKLQQLARSFAGEGGMKAKLAEPLAEDADFIRKLKPSLIKARARGEAPTNQEPGKAPLPPPSPKPERKKRKKSGGGGATPFIVVGVALVAGIALAKWIDWRGHAHPRD